MQDRRHFIFVSMLLLSACKPSTPVDSESSISTASAPASPAVDALAREASHDTQRNKEVMSPIRNVLTVFASAQSAAWSAFDGVSGVQWRDAAPVENPDATTPDVAMYRSGNLLLSGFGMVEVPDGKEGAEAGSKQDNEGNVGVTLNGDKASVQSFVLVKFYASEDYESILKGQLDAGDTVETIAGSCKLDFDSTEENSQKNAFYRLDLSGGTSAYVEVYVDEEGGKNNPGSTTFEFSRQLPVQRIRAMQCQEA